MGELQAIAHRLSFCTRRIKHKQHPYQILSKPEANQKPEWVNLWCHGEELDEGQEGTTIMVLIDPDCWCQDPELLLTRMTAAVGHVLDKVREIVDAQSEKDEWEDRWQTIQTREIVPVKELLDELRKIQPGMENDEDEDEDEDEDGRA